MSKTALITGATKGIGLALTKRLVREGWRVVTIARSEMPLDVEVMHHIQANLATGAGIETACAESVTCVQELDLLVNNAGAIASDEDWKTVSIEALTASYLLHAVAPLMLTRALAPALKASNRGAVVNLSTIYARIPDPEVLAYGMSKAAQEYVTRTSALRLAPDIRVNALAPGHVDTQMTLSAPKDFLQSVLDSIPQARLETKNEAVSAILFLGGDGALGVTGTTLTMDGGFSIRGGFE